MRSFVAALLMAGATVTAQNVGEYLECASAAMEGIDVSKLNDCSNKSSTECLCTNKEAISELTQSAKDACKKAGVDVNDLSASLCGNSGNKMAAPGRHASRPMEPAEDMPMDMDMDMDKMMHNTRAYSPTMHTTESEMPDPASEHESGLPHREAVPKVIYVTETITECGCKSTPTPHSMHISQIPVDVPVASSSSIMGAMLPASSPAMSNSVMVGASSSSVLFGSHMSTATPGPSSASPHHFNAFQGAAPAVDAAQGGIAALGVAAVMGLMIAL